MRFLELKIPPVAVALVFAVAMWLSSGRLPGAAVSIPGRRPIAVALFVAGVAIALAGVAAFRRHGTTLNPMRPADAATVVDTGVFRYTRNPMYLGLTLALSAWAAWLGNLAAFGLVALFAAYLTAFQIRPEERAMRTAFGAAWEDYVARVRRWL